MSFITQLGIHANQIHSVFPSNFSIVTWRGNGSTQSVTGVGFQPDMVMVLYGTGNSVVFDTIQGTGKYWALGAGLSQTTDANSITSFDSDGFSVGNSTVVNQVNVTYFAYCFKQSAGFFDMQTYTGNGSNRDIAHNLQAIPAMYFVKEMDNNSDAAWYHKNANGGVNPEKYYFEVFNNVSQSSFRWNDTAPTHTNIRIGTVAQVNRSGSTFIAYLFGEQKGNSYFGAYAGNNNATGPVVPALNDCDCVFIKSASLSNRNMVTYSHAIWGNDQTSINPKTLGASIASGGAVTSEIDLNAGNFQPKSTGNLINANENYLYFAFRARTRHGTVAFTPSASSFTIPNLSGMPSSVSLEAWGAGGNGGNGDTNFAGGGGGGGAYTQKIKTVAVGNVINFSVGTPGNSTTIDGMTAGHGSNGANASGSNGNGGSGGTASGGTVNTNGAAGTNGNGTTGGNGGASPNGGGTRTGGTGAGSNGFAPGGGAAGGGNGSDAGGTGANGQVRISW